MLEEEDGVELCLSGVAYKNVIGVLKPEGRGFVSR
jgi:hypothetical protein